MQLNDCNECRFLKKLVGIGQGGRCAASNLKLIKNVSTCPKQSSMDQNLRDFYLIKQLYAQGYSIHEISAELEIGYKYTFTIQKLKSPPHAGRVQAQDKSGRRC